MDPAEPDVEFKPLTAADRSATLALMRDYYAEDGHSFREEIASRALDHLTDDASLGALWLIRRAGATIGYLCIGAGFSLEAGGGDYFLDELYVVPAARGAGIGRAAMAFAENECRTRGALRLCLEVQKTNTRARAWYEVLGYGAHDRHLMSKTL